MKTNYANAIAVTALVVAFGGTASFAWGTTEGSEAEQARSSIGAVQVYKKRYELPSPTPVNYFGKFTVLCPSDKQAIGGGGLGVINIKNSYPSTSSSGTAPSLTPDSFKGWTVSGSAPPLVIGGSQTVYVICVSG